ncbi:MAG: two-component regulator propeller domain-containing protein [Crocinitomicaceae bacterium]
MVSNSLLFLISIVFLFSCNTPKSVNNQPKDAVGQIVSEIGQSCWLVFQANNGDYWFGGDSTGVYRYDGKKILHYSEGDGLSSNSIRGIQEGQSGNIFFTTLSGISKFDGTQFSTLKPIKSKNSNENWKLQADDLWFSILGKKGPYRYDGEHLYQLEFPKHYLADDYFKQFPNNAWSPYEVYSIYKDNKGNMWFGTSNFGVCRYDGKELSWLYEDQMTNTPNGGSFGIRSILEDKTGHFWFCNSHYRYTISPEVNRENDRNLVTYTKEKGMDGITSGDGGNFTFFLSSVQDDAGDIWLVTYNEGVWRYNEKGVKHYSVKYGNKNITLFSIYEDKQGDLWLGSHENGAFKWNGKAFEKFVL